MHTFFVVKRLMKDRPKKVRIKFHSGYKGNEIPRSVILDEKEFSIEKIIERERILNPKTGKVQEEYIIKVKDTTAILKIHDSQESEITFLFS
jgi:hypothetical protein